MKIFIAEFLGSMISAFLEAGAGANSGLKASKGYQSGWMVLSSGWALSVALPSFIFSGLSGSHFNPIITMFFAFMGLTPWKEVPKYYLGQFIGAFAGGILVYIMYKTQLKETHNKTAKLEVFAVSLQKDNIKQNIISNFLGVWILLMVILPVVKSTIPNEGKIFAIAMILFGLVTSFGGIKGFVINPFRDLCARIAYTVLPLKDKTDPCWKYAWVPVIGTFLGIIPAVIINNFIL